MVVKRLRYLSEVQTALILHMRSTPKENILKKIRQALTAATPQPFPESGDNGNVFIPASQELDICFAETFSRLQGNFSYCLSETEMVSQLKLLAEHRKWSKWYCNDAVLQNIFAKNKWPFEWHQNLEDCNASLTGCESLVARTGTMVLSSIASGGRTASVYAPVHICIAYTSQLVYDVRDALERLQQKYGKNIPSMISFASGPSRTADIEKTLVTGVHGPKEVYCFLIEGEMPL